MRGAHKRIADPVHGTIPLTQLEVELVETETFQRLRNVKQLGLANYVFPSADYSRFSHCVGVCHVTGRILDSIGEQYGDLSSEEWQVYRTAALLHDIGHYPYSHPFEHALKEHFAQAQLVDAEQAQPDQGEEGMPEPYLDHEEVSQAIVTSDAQVQAALERHGVDPVEVYRTFLREQPPRYANLISSDLDADRIDYLLRTAHHTGLPHGWVDLDYLLTQIRLDEDDYLCLTPKAARAAEHMLLGRYFDYQQVAFHKTVAGLEWVLKDLVAVLLDEGRLPGTRGDIAEAVRSGEWRRFDDVSVMNQIRRLPRETNVGYSVIAKCRSLINRNPPKVLASFERLGDRDGGLREMAGTWRGVMRNIVSTLAQEWGLPEDLFHIWDPSSTGLVLTKVGAHVPVSAMVEEEAEEWDKYQQAVRILGPGQSSVLLSQERSSIISILSDQALFLSRVYLLLPEDRLPEREAIEGRCSQLMGEFGLQ